MIHLSFRPYDEEDFRDKCADVYYIVDTLWDHGYTIADEDAYRAWLAGGDGVWANPFEYSDTHIVSEIVCECNYITDTDIALTNPFLNEWVEAETADYTPKQNAKVEGFAYDAD